MNKDLIIINTGGTFNKIYETSSGELIVSQTNKTIHEIVKKICKNEIKIKIDGLIYKDSLQMKKKDRLALLKNIQSRSETKIIIIHGTDTMNKSARVLAKFIKNKIIVFVGSMQPYSIEPVEASATLFMAIGFLENIEKNEKNNVFICMNGLIKEHSKIKKNYTKGVFECR